MHRFVIIGGSGFVGQYCIDLLLQRFSCASIINLDLRECNKWGDRVSYHRIDLLQGCAFDFLSDDIVIHLAARQYHPKPPRKNRENYFFELNFLGTKSILQRMLQCNCTKMIYFSTDMVYGIPREIPIQTSCEPRPFGPYGRSKLASEKLLSDYREHGFTISIFRPRMIVGRGRYGLLEKLFFLIDHHLPIPLIGDGKNCYQMLSVRDCVEAIVCAIKKGIPDASFNLGSANPPSIKTLLNGLIEQVGSRSILLPVNGNFIKFALSVLGKAGIELMFEEQYRIADCDYLVDITQAREELGWIPQDSDLTMLYSAYEEYKNGR